jgi:hypothetical protein
MIVSKNSADAGVSSRKDAAAQTEHQELFRRPGHAFLIVVISSRNDAGGKAELLPVAADIMRFRRKARSSPDSRDENPYG